MALIRAFRAIRPRTEYAGRVISLPYDVMNREEAKRMAEDNPYSVLHICRAEIDMPEETDPYAAAVYEKRAKILRNILSAEFFFVKKSRCFTYTER